MVLLQLPEVPTPRRSQVGGIRLPQLLVQGSHGLNIPEKAVLFCLGQRIGTFGEGFLAKNFEVSGRQAIFFSPLMQ